MKCATHPSAEVLKGKRYCFLCQDWSQTLAGVESDRRKFERELVVQQIAPGTTGVRTHGQYQRFLKRHGMTDDVPTKQVMALTRDTGKRERVREEKIRTYLERMTPVWRASTARHIKP